MIISRTVTVHIHVTFITYSFQITGVPLVIPSTTSNVISPTSTTSSISSSTTSSTSSSTTSSITVISSTSTPGNDDKLFFSPIAY